MKNAFTKAVLVKSLLFLLIVLWGGYNSTLEGTKGSTEYFTDVGNILFLFFSKKQIMFFQVLVLIINGTVGGTDKALHQSTISFLILMPMDSMIL